MRYPKLQYSFAILRNIIFATSFVMMAILESVSQQQFPVETMIFLSPPYPSNLDAYIDFLEQGVIEINNTTNEELELYFSILLEETSGKIKLDSDGPVEMSLLTPSGNLLLSAMDIQDLFGGLTDGDFKTAGLSPAERDAILLNRQMPEGNYRICIQAYDEIGTQLSNPAMGGGCFEFSVTFAERPIIDAPYEGEELDSVGSFIVPLWSHNLSDIEAQLRTEYNLKIIDLTEQNITNIENAMLDPGVSAEYEENVGSAYSTILQDDVELPLAVGHRYAMRVTAIDPDNLIAYQFGGHSEIVTFWYGLQSTDDEDNVIPDGVIAAPITTSPQDGDELELGNDNRINFSWDHEVKSDISTNTQYMLKIADVTGIANTIDDWDDLDKVSMTYILEQNVTDPKISLDKNFTSSLEVGRTYAWFIHATTEKNIIYANNGYSQVTTFSLTKPKNTPLATDEAGCTSDAVATLPLDQNPVTLNENSEVEMGNFIMRVESLTGGKEGYEGGGYITLDFISKIKIRVNFQDLQVNKDKKAFSGMARAVYEEGFEPTGTGNVATHLGAHIPAIGADGAQELRDAYNNVSRLVSALSGNEPVTLPLGWDRTIAGQKMVVGLSEMTFSPTEGKMTAMMGLENPEWGTLLPSFAASEIIFSPEGFDKGVRLFLLQDFAVNFGDNSLTLKAFDQDGAVQDTGCYILLDCEGFKEGRLSAEATFSRDVVVPDSEDGSPGAGQVVASMRGDFVKGNHFVLTGSIDAFQIPGLEGFSLSVDNLVYDHSEFQSPFEGILNANSSLDFIKDALELTNQEEVNRWKGFYIENLTLNTPRDWMKEGKRKSISVQHLIIEKSGLTAGFETTNLFSLEEGDFSGWALSLDTFRLEIIQSNFREGSLSGQLGLPILQKREGLVYNGVIGQTKVESKNANANDSEEMGITFSVSPGDNLTVPLFVANVTFSDDSSIKMEYSKSNKKISAILHGSLSINNDALPTSLQDLTKAVDIDLPKIKFQDMKLSSTDKKFTAPTFSLVTGEVSDEASIAGFPINSDPTDGMEAEADDSDGITFTINPKISIVGKQNGLTAAAKISFVSQLTDGYYTLESVNPESLTINGKTAGFTFEGKLEFYNKNNYKGIKGELEIGTPVGFAVGLKTEFGVYKKATATSADYGSQDYYSYWQLEGLVQLGKGVPIGAGQFQTGQSLYGFGGGAWYNMTMTKPDKEITGDDIRPSGENDSETQTSGFSFTPQAPSNQGDVTIGLQATVIIGLTGSREAFFADATLGVQYTTNNGGGLDIGLAANAYFMTGKGLNKESANVTANGKIIVGVKNITENPNLTFDASLDIFVNVEVGTTIKGAGENNLMVHGAMHFETEDPDNWYVFLGKPSKKGALEIEGLGEGEITGYFMMGPAISNELPTMPKEITQILSGTFPGFVDRSDATRAEDGDAVSQELADKSRSRDAIKYSTGKGVMLGLQFRYRLDETYYDFIKLNFGAVAGFDILMTHNPETTCGGSPIGINGWYASGQVYAGIWGGVDIHVDLWFIKKDINVFQAAAALAVKGGGPNPVWINGKGRLSYSVLNDLVSGTISFEIDLGEKCDPFGGNPFGEVAFIDDLTPKSKTSIYSDFDLTLMNEMREYKFRQSEDPNNKKDYDKWNIIEPYIANFIVSEKNNPNNIFTEYTRTKKQNGLQYTWSTTDPLRPNTEYTVEVILKARNKVKPGSPNLVVFDKVSKKEVEWTETRKNTFKTSSAPDVIPDEIVMLMFPLDKQRYHLPKHGKIGFLKLKSSLHNSVISSTQTNTELIARFTNLKNGDVSESQVKSIRGNYQYMQFAKPDLQNSRVYKVQIIRRTTLAYDDSQKTKSIVIEKASDGNTANTSAFSVIKTGDRKQIEKIMYEWHFGTSMFNLFTEKVNFDKEHASLMFSNMYVVKDEKHISSQLGWTTEYTEVKVAEPEIQITTLEPFDYVEIYGFRKHGKSQFPGLWEVQDMMTYGWSGDLNKPGGAYYDYLHLSPNGEGFNNSNTESFWRTFRKNHDNTFPWNTINRTLNPSRVHTSARFDHKYGIEKLSNFDIQYKTIVETGWQNKTTVQVYTDRYFLQNLIINGLISMGSLLDQNGDTYYEYDYFKHYYKQSWTDRQKITCKYKVPMINGSADPSFINMGYSSRKLIIN